MKHFVILYLLLMFGNVLQAGCKSEVYPLKDESNDVVLIIRLYNDRLCVQDEFWKRYQDTEWATDQVNGFYYDPDETDNRAEIFCTNKIDVLVHELRHYFEGAWHE